MQPNNSSPLISHKSDPIALSQKIESSQNRIIAAGDKPYVTIKQQLQYLEELSTFELGKYVIIHQGLNGYWTHYILTHSKKLREQNITLKNKQFSKMEQMILDMPFSQATQQRFAIFLQANQKQVKNGANLASIPCGLMGELLHLDFSEIKQIELTGIDYDRDALYGAKNFAIEKNLNNWVTLQQQNAWEINCKNKYGLISSNGLTIYEPDDAKVTELYSIFYQALRNGGNLTTSFLTPKAEWNMNAINFDDLLTQQIIFFDVLQLKCSCFRARDITYKQLKTAGFKTIDFISDTANMFPTVIAYK